MKLFINFLMFSDLKNIKEGDYPPSNFAKLKVEATNPKSLRKKVYFSGCK